MFSSDKDNYQTLFGALDNCFLVAYAIGMFIRCVCFCVCAHIVSPPAVCFNPKVWFWIFCSGIFGERLPLRYYLSVGMLMSGLFTCLFGLGFYLNIHSLAYYAFVQVLRLPHNTRSTLTHLQPARFANVLNLILYRAILSQLIQDSLWKKKAGGRSTWWKETVGLRSSDCRLTHHLGRLMLSNISSPLLARG